VCTWSKRPLKRATVLTPQPFKVDIPDATLADLRARLERTRWPDEPPAAGWNFGSNVGYMQQLVDYWRTRFDWRAQEAKLNELRQFTVPLGGIDLHFIHEQGKGPKPLPLLLSHGWPGSVFEFHKIIPMLTDPERFGGDPADAFTVVAPSLPGYVFSFKPGQPRFSAQQIGALFAQLMSEVLGYKRYAAQGGDWGSFVTSVVGLNYPQQVCGIHLNLMPLRRDPKMVANPDAEQSKFLEELALFLKEETGYQWIQGTRPQTLAFGLTDSPAGLAAWIVEKFRKWTDCGGDVESVLSKDEMLTNITLYWATGAIGSSFWPYYARMHGPWPVPEGSFVEVPTAYIEFPAEILRPPRSLAQQVFNIQRWTKMPRGGHFAALEQPQALVEDVRAFFRPLRGG
jgi:pimeloyl-ACP methyl ester carboxylesterase